MSNVIALPGSGFSVPQPLTADREQIARFVNALFRYADPGTFAALRSFPDGGASGPPVGRRDVEISAAGLEVLATVATGMASDAARHPTAAVFCPPIATFAQKGKADRASLANGLALSVELDARPAEARRRLEGILGPVTVVVKSGGWATDPETGEVEDRLHLHWRLTEPTRTGPEHDALTEARTLAARLVVGDPTSASPVHPMRWPGSWHRKREPVMAGIIGGDPVAEIDLGEALDLLREAVGAATITPTSERRPAPSTTLTVGGGRTAAIEDVREWLDQIPNDADWHEWCRIGLAAWAATRGSDAGFDAFDTWSARSTKYDATTTRARWDAFGRSPPSKIGAGTLAYLAAQNSPPGRATEAHQGAVDGADDDGGARTPSAPETRHRAAHAPRRPRLIRADHFLADLVFPDPLVDGMVARGFLYSMTGPTGHGKTTVATSLALSVAAGRAWAGRQVEQGRVLLLAGENPTDAGLRLDAARQRLGVGDDAIRQIAVVADVFDVEAEAEDIAAQVAEFGPLALVVVDTAAAFFTGDDENANPAMRRYASVLRGLVGLPGNPAVVVLSHPTKGATRDNLKPRGGGAFLAEVDGNLTVWRDDAGIVTLHHDKLRGPSFEPVAFELETVEIAGRKDTKGRHPASVVAVHVSDERAERLEAVAEANEMAVLRAVAADPTASLAAIARGLGWLDRRGNEQTSRVQRILGRLARDKLIVPGPGNRSRKITKDASKLLGEAVK